MVATVENGGPKSQDAHRALDRGSMRSGLFLFRARACVRLCTQLCSEVGAMIQASVAETESALRRPPTFATVSNALKFKQLLSGPSLCVLACSSRTALACGDNCGNEYAL